MKKTIDMPLRMAALITSFLPLTTLLPVFFNITLSDRVRCIWTGVNLLCGLLGIVLSILCIRSSSSHKALSILSLTTSSMWLLMMAGPVALALLLNYI